MNLKNFHDLIGYRKGMMANRGEETTKLRRQYTREAIQMAVESRWQEAVVTNKNILEFFPNDVDALNRLGRALMELGEYEKAKEAYSKALKQDPTNQIAQKNFNRLSLLEGKDKKKPTTPHKIMPHIFVEEIGKAGVVVLENLAATAILARMSAGNQVSLRVRGQSLIAETAEGEYLGKVESRHGFRLIKLIEGGNKYAAAITSISLDEVKIIIKEIFQHPSQIGQLSFPVREPKGFRPDLKETILQYEAKSEEEGEIHEEGEEVSDTEEEAEAFADSFSLIEGSSLRTAIEEAEIEKED